jgi:hypothetical protein
MKKLAIPYRAIAVAFAVLSIASCAFVEMSGKMTAATGEVMSDYAKTDSGLIGKMAGYGGRINTSVGKAVENAARTDDPSKGAGERLSTANKQVWNAATEAASGKPRGSASQQ